ncbi:MAG: hypothetical protein ACK44O_16255 [Novosphingobium sp.]|jgi:hypothetical protein|uniref:hypothetical protein n=1 Tax=Novosphingobium sp. TaxID=1874826 RepID=UPI00391AC439|nr:hypothetical protein [Novosphingobium sp.]
MGIVLGLIVMVLLPAALSWGICSGMRVLSPESTRRRRVGIAATVAGVVPVLLPLVAMVRRGLPYGVIPILALVVLGLIIAVLVGLPVAIRTTRNDFPA